MRWPVGVPTRVIAARPMMTWTDTAIFAIVAIARAAVDVNFPKAASSLIMMDCLPNGVCIRSVRSRMQSGDLRANPLKNYGVTS